MDEFSSWVAIAYAAALLAVLMHIGWRLDEIAKMMRDKE